MDIPLQNDIPEELQSYKWLNVLGGSRFIVMLYNELGAPLWAAGKSTHNYSELIEKYFEGSVFDFFNMESVTDLNDAFKKRQDLSNVLNHVGLMNDKGISPTYFPFFNSFNKVEQSVLCPYFSIKQPLTIICLMRLNKNRFIGLILLRPISYLISLSQKKNILLADSNNKIVGYSSLFSSPLKLSLSDTLLGRNVDEIMAFSRSPFDEIKYSSVASMTPLADWKEGYGEFPFEKEQEDYTYFRFVNKFPVDNVIFRLEIRFISSGQKIPNVIMRGITLNSNRSADVIGYSLTNSINEAGCRFKKSAGNVKYLHLPELDDGREYLLAIQKESDCFYFFLDGKMFGVWHDTTPFLVKGDDLLYLFYRPGESLKITSFRAWIKELNGRYKANDPIVASYRDFGINKSFNVTVEESTIGTDNCVFYQFEDVTTFVNNIETLKAERDHLSELVDKADCFVGKSKSIVEIKDNLGRIVDKNISVLIEGETGTGKEVLARSIHKASDRSKKPFIKIDCSVLPAALIESELFGHEKGAFTGAIASHTGKFEQANGGTVFLDEISNLTLDMQAKLLGVLQDNLIYRLGGTRAIKINFRLIAASNIPLLALIEKKLFRPDLYYRIGQFSFKLPPLRERLEDIPLLTEFFIKEANSLYGKNHMGISRKALEKLYGHNWAGNVRELRNSILRASVLCNKDTIDDCDLQFDMQIPVSKIGNAHLSVRKRRKKVRENELRGALGEAEGHVGEAASILGISRAMIYILLKRYNIKPDQFRNIAEGV